MRLRATRLSAVAHAARIAVGGAAGWTVIGLSATYTVSLSVIDGAGGTVTVPQQVSDGAGTLYTPI